MRKIASEVCWWAEWVLGYIKTAAIALLVLVVAIKGIASMKDLFHL
jgi:hypothetical protein